MKDNNKHPHHDLIVEWAKDTSKQPQIKTLADDAEWQDCSILAVISNYKFLARFKPREFTKGHWYPCLRHDGVVLVRMFDGLGMGLGVDVGLSINPLQFKGIGKSLGMAEFNE